jgi:hypothetical protein
MSTLDLLSIGDPFITASGSTDFSDNIFWPFGSGRANAGFSEDVDALLTSVNAQFGFNQTPHRFNLTWALRTFSDFDNGPPNIIGDLVDFLIGSLRIRGRVSHVDTQKSDNGAFLTTSIEDVRKDMTKAVIDTYGLFDESQDPASIAPNVIDVHHRELTTGINRDPKELRLLREHGATWIQLKEAIQDFDSGLFNSLPPDRFIFSRLGQDKADAYRWSFRTTPLLNAIIKIFTYLAYDLYWSMDEQRLKAVDRQQRITIGVDQIPGVDVGVNIIKNKQGVDEGERPTSVQVIGGQMEGVIGGGGGAVTTTQGVFPNNSSVQLTIEDGYTFKPAWQGASVFYFGADGTLKEDLPNDEELSAALKGIEWWAQKKAQVTTADEAIASRVDNNSIYPRTGVLWPNFSGNSASGVALLPNRGTTEDKWVIEWYNRVRNFAQNHYTRTYFLDSKSPLFDELDRFEVLDEAWCGLENELDGGGSFNTGYKIDGQFRWLAPFWNEDTNKLRAWMFIDGQPLWGVDGKGVPAQFTDWNEDGENGIYIPIEVQKWNRASSRLTNDSSLLPAERADRGLTIRLPNICWRGFEADPALANMRIPKYLQGKFQSETTFDMTIDPLTRGLPFEQFIQGINIPIVITERYGTAKPTQWSAGSSVIDLSRAEVQQRDDLVPWSFEPRGPNTTVDLLDLEGQGIADGRVVNRGTVDFLEISAAGLPVITFDQYANNAGVASHGITSLSLNKNADNWWQTRYSAKTHFPQPVQIKPVPEEVMEDFRFALHRVNERFNRPTKPLPFSSPEIFNPKTEDGKEFLQFPIKESLEILVTITDITPVALGNGLTDIAYAGEDETGLKWPASFRAQEQGSLNPDSRLAQFLNAFAVDGFFQKGMQATYHYEELDNGDIVHYFTGGVALSQARIVTALESPGLVEGLYRMDVEVPQETFQRAKPNTNPVEFETLILEKIEVKKARFSDNDNVDTTIKAGDELMLSGTGNENGNMLKPTFNATTEQYEIDVGNNAPTNQKDKLILLTGARGGAGVQFATVEAKPNLVTGRGGKIQTISSIEGGTLFEDQKIIGAGEGNPGTQYFVDFIGLEYNQIALGDPCVVIQETEPAPEDPAVAAVTPVKIRLLTYINKPLFTATDAFGAAT